MGLANLRGRAASIGGELEITSPAGEGTTVRVSLPL
jgi:signal transduction histidine kinase